MAQGDTRPSVEALASLPEFHNPTIGPDGERVAFYYDGTGRNELYVLDVGIQETTRLSDGEVPRDATHPIAWSADGDGIYFHKDEDGEGGNDIHVYTLEGDHDIVLETEGQAYLEDVGSNGQYLLFTITEGSRKNLYRYELRTDDVDQLTSYERPVRHGTFDPDADRIAYTTNETRNPNNQDVYVAAVDGSNPRRLEVGESGSETKFGGWSPDGSAVLVDAEKDGFKRCGYYELESERVTWFGPGAYEERSLGVHPDGEIVLAARNRECGVVPVRYDVETGEGTELAFDDGVCVGSSRYDDGFLSNGDALLSYTCPDTRKALYRYDVASDDHEILVEPDYGDVDPAAFVDAEYVTIHSNGRDEFFGNEGAAYEIECLLYEPEDGREAGIVKVHGGPHYHATKRFNVFVQFLATRGYTVLVPNFRGSTGRGREFRTAIHGDWGGLEQEDVAAAGRWLKSRESVDEDRVGVYGISYGGYSAYMQLVKHPQIWAAGVACVGFTDLLAVYEETMSYLKTVLRQQMGDPDENAELWRERSPLTHVDRLEQPLLMIQGVDDRRCPVTQTRKFRAALEERGWVEGEDFVYEELEDEGHGSTDSGRIQRIFRTMDGYLDERL